MSKSEINYEGVEEFSLSEYCEEAYLNYALYVIKDRALPFIGDGLKPVQRRIIYTMAIEGINSADKKKKSAYTVGQVLGRFHPHGDSACYGAMVNMTQDFNLRYPLIRGQGNFGDAFDPQGYAAMRYTESYLSEFSSSLLSELNSGNVVWQANYNGDEKEPKYLPARIPQILLNGTTGIAVGMATDVPPHNSREVIEATCELIKNPNTSLEELLQIIPGPDYPTKAEIINTPEEILEIYRTGRGKFRQRAVWHKEKDEVIITQLPYQSAPNLIVQIANLIQGKKILNLDDVRDESSETETRIVLQLKSSRTDAEALMNQLFVYTDLEKSLSVNLNLIGLNGKPAVKGLKEILLEWIDFRREIVRLRLETRLNKLENDLNRIRGFLIAFNNLDLVIEIVRNEPEPKPVLMSRLELNDEQATAILELRIKSLAKLEEEKLRKQEQTLLKEQKQINALLSSKSKFDKNLIAELEQAKEEFGQERNTPLKPAEAAKIIKVKEEIPCEPIHVVLSKHGWIRVGKGHEVDLEKLQYRRGDEYQTHLEMFTDETIYLVGNQGRVYNLMPNQIPMKRGNNFGEPITTLLKTEGESIQSIFTGSDEQRVIFAQSSGTGFACQVQDLKSRTAKGKDFVDLEENSTLIDPLLIPAGQADTKVMLVTTLGNTLILPSEEILVRNKGGKGVKLIELSLTSRDLKSGITGDNQVRNLLVYPTNGSLMIKNKSRSTTIPADKLESAQMSRGSRGKRFVIGFNPNTQIKIK